MSLTLQERIARCDREIALCLVCAGDTSLTPMEHYGATLGEADWSVEKMRLERLLEKEQGI